jgi:hypothetical protein
LLRGSLLVQRWRPIHEITRTKTKRQKMTTEKCQMRNGKSLLSQRWFSLRLYLVGFDRVNPESCRDRFQFSSNKPSRFSCWPNVKMSYRSFIRQDSDTLCNHSDSGLHIAVHGICDLILKNLSLSKLCDSDLQTSMGYCCQVTESVQLTLGQ